MGTVIKRSLNDELLLWLMILLFNLNLINMNNNLFKLKNKYHKK